MLNIYTCIDFLESPYYSKPRKVASWRALRTAGSMPLGSRMSLTPQKLWLGTSKQGLVPATPVYREKEDMYDEIIELKKSLHMQKSDVDLMRTKLRRLEEENSRKDRQIEQLLDPSRGTDFVRTLAEKRPDTGWVISGLKQRILRLEQQCKEKDGTINKLQTDMKTTNLEEMRIAMETYYEEIHRLQTLLASSETTGKKPQGEKKIGVKRQKKMSSALLSLSRSVQELTEENQSLKEDLDRVLSNSPTISRIQGYVEWSKPRLLRRITELEKRLSSMENSKSLSPEPVRSTSPARSASSSTLHRQPHGDCREDHERLRGAVKNLKRERAALQTQLQEREPKRNSELPLPARPSETWSQVQVRRGPRGPPPPALMGEETLPPGPCRRGGRCTSTRKKRLFWTRRLWCSRQPSGGTWHGRSSYQAERVSPSLLACQAFQTRALPQPAFQAPSARPRAAPNKRRPPPSSSQSSGHTWRGPGTVRPVKEPPLQPLREDLPHTKKPLLHPTLQLLQNRVPQGRSPPCRQLGMTPTPTTPTTLSSLRLCPHGRAPQPRGCLQGDVAVSKG
ncbi:IQ domain-containing protein E isoform X4 [Carlito syrichta]|uniref:IQ domain-containing protein E isoform X4 n=1 Tax=Carlito syrichta TaxID=1868482 RepID=A0A1U7T5F6_CARSF|nr:IQ domain-containing protein E isoform X4 [Carlito syrichta]